MTDFQQLREFDAWLKNNESEEYQTVVSTQTSFFAPNFSISKLESFLIATENFYFS